MISEMSLTDKRLWIHLGYIILFLLLGICVFLILSPGNVVAETSGDFDYQLINDNTEVVITGYYGSGGDIEIPSEIEGKPVTQIGGFAFYQCSSLTSVIIPSGVTIIEDNAFYQCSNLASVNIPDGVTTIGGWVFYQCQLLTSVALPETVTTIGDAAFGGCISLTSVNIPSGVTSIRPLLFYECWSLDSVIIPENVTEIGAYAFYCCSSLTSLDIPSGVTCIEENAFFACFNLASINIPDGVVSIGSWAFYQCISLTSLILPESVTTIGDAAFWSCTNLASVNIPSGVTSIKMGLFMACNSLASIIIPDSVTSIEAWAFFQCSSLTSIIIPENVATIGYFAFSSDTLMTQMYFEGNAPTCDDWWIYGYNPDLTIYYYYGHSGFSTPFWYGIRCVCINLNPVELSVTPNSATVQPGEAAVYEVSVTNLGSTAKQMGLKLETTDGSDPRILIDWFSLSLYEFSLDAGESITVTLSVAIPAEWASVEDVTTSVLLSVTDDVGTTTYDSELVGLTVKATQLSAIIAVNGATVDIVSDIDQAIVNPTPEAVDNIRTELVELISMIQESMDNGLIGLEDGQGLLASVNAALSSIDRSDSALDEAKMNLVGNALATAQNQLNALMNKLMGIES